MPKYQSEPSQKWLQAALDYNPETGVFTWKGGRLNTAGRRITRFVGAVAGFRRKDGYIEIGCGTLGHFLAHRLAWIYMHGAPPKSLIDHKNQNRSDNRIENLRAADRSENARNSRCSSNNTSGHKGVSWIGRRNKWRVQLVLNKRMAFSGNFDRLEDAVEAIKAAREKLHGEFARHL